MLKVVLLFVLAFGFVACNEDDIAELVKGDPIAIPTGAYESNCVVEGAGSNREALNVISQTEVSIEVTEYASTTDCTGAGVAGGAQTLEIQVADFSFANTVSFFYITAEEDYKAYHISEGLLYLSESKEGVTEENAASTFSDFITDPKAEAELVYTPVP